MNFSSDEKNHGDVIHVLIGGQATGATLPPLPHPPPNYLVQFFSSSCSFFEKIAKIIGWRSHWTHYLIDQAKYTAKAMG